MSLSLLQAHRGCGRYNDVNLHPDELCGDLRGALITSFRPAIFNRYCAALNPIMCAQALHKCIDPWGVERGYASAQEPDCWQLRCLLRARNERRRRCAAYERNKLAPPHSITSSARAIKFGGKVRPIAPAALRLTDKVNLSGACTGRSPGRTPRKV